MRKAPGQYRRLGGATRTRRALFDRLHTIGLVMPHDSTDAAYDVIARSTCDGHAITAATNDEAHDLNAPIRDERVRTGLVDDSATTTDSDGLSIGAGAVIATRRNDSDVQVANRQTCADRRRGRRQPGPGRRPRAAAAVGRGGVLDIAAQTHLACAATTYGVQSPTTPASRIVASGPACRWPRVCDKISL